jgi:uncharacterized protein (DUF362 family)
MSQVVAKVKSTHSLENDIRTAIGIIGGLERILEKNSKVVIKPNLNSGDPFPASSDPLFIQALGKVLLDYGIDEIRIVESSMFMRDTTEEAEKNGLLRVADNFGAKIEFLDGGRWINTEIPKGEYLRNAQLGQAVLTSDPLITVPCLKTHKFAKFTGAMKLYMGYVRGRDRLRMHLRHLEEKIADLASYFKPRLVLMDARKVFVTGGPVEGKVENPNVILAGTDSVAIDAVGVAILKSYNEDNKLGYPTWELPQLAHAAKLGFGAIGPQDIELVEAP